MWVSFRPASSPPYPDARAIESLSALNLGNSPRIEHAEPSRLRDRGRSTMYRGNCETAQVTRHNGLPPVHAGLLRL
jgi:hypothetical protein